MLLFSNSEAELRRSVSVVVTDLRDATSLDASSVLVVGAEARNLIHSALGHEFELRRTTDIDLAVGLSDWSVYERIVATYPQIGSNGIRYRIAGRAVDVMPFGQIEDPTGIATPVPRRDGLVVFGFQEVFNHSLPLDLGEGVVVRGPTPAGYAALKVRAWIDRSPDFNYRDAPDLSIAHYWYANSALVADRLWNHADGVATLQARGFDEELAAAELLGRDVAAILGVANGAILADLWRHTDRQLLAENFSPGVAGLYPQALARRRAIVDAFGTAFG